VGEVEKVVDFKPLRVPTRFQVPARKCLLMRESVFFFASARLVELDSLRAVVGEFASFTTCFLRFIEKYDD
jgi:hypothetical protein